MKVDCQWFGANLEAYFCEGLGVEELRLASEHLNTCLSCKSEVQALRDVDPVVKQVLDFRMAKARTAALAPRRSIGFQIGLAGAGVALAAALVFAVFIRQPSGSGESAAVIAPTLQSSDSSNTKSVKGDGSAPTGRLKPDAPDQPTSVKPTAPEPIIPEGAPEFAVIDPYGYGTSLADYRGRVLLFGIWSADHREATQNLQRVYQAFGSRRGLSVLGVARRKQDQLPGITFPMVFNDGSRLLEAHESDYVVIDKEGRVQMRGSLAEDANVLIPKIRAKLDQLGVR